MSAFDTILLVEVIFCDYFLLQQMRLNLSTWLGVGEAFSEMLNDKKHQKK